MVESNTFADVLVSLLKTLRRLKSAMSYNDDLSTGENLHVPASSVPCRYSFATKRSRENDMQVVGCPNSTEEGG